MKKMRYLGWTLLVLVLLLGGAAGGIVALNLRGEDPLPEHAETFNATPQQVERGRYLALAGNCAGCHTTRGGQPYAWRPADRNAVRHRVLEQPDAR